MPMMKKNKMSLGYQLLFCLFLSFGACRAKAPKLETYNVDESLISVSGLSSGAYFAVQFHVAFSKSIMGVGVIAGGPYYCAQNDLEIAVSACMVEPELISVPELVDITYSTAATLTIDPPAHMKDDQVYIFSGVLDSVVVQGVAKKLAEYYSEFLYPGKMLTELTIPAQHAFPTDDRGLPCNIFGSPYIVNCSYSAAYHLLNHIYGDVQYANASAAKAENLLEFDQTEFLLDIPKAVSMDTTGYVYVPSSCKSRSSVCRLHVAFHGCLQGREFADTDFALMTDLSGIGEVNNIIILYPQAINTTLNPAGCWDWWGYTGIDYGFKLVLENCLFYMLEAAINGNFKITLIDTCKLAPQMAACDLMMKRVAGVWPGLGARQTPKDTEL